MNSPTRSPFNSLDEVTLRLSRPGEHSIEEIRGLFPFIGDVSRREFGLSGRLECELAIHTLVAIRDFDESSRALTKRLYWLTWVLVALAAVTVLLALPTAWPLLRSFFGR